MLLTGILGMVSCTEYLDKAPQSDINENVPFANFRNFQGFVEELYNNIPLLSACQYHSEFNYGEEEMANHDNPDQFGPRIDKGDYWAWSTLNFCRLRPGGNPQGTDRLNDRRLWANAWYGVNKANIGIKNLEKFVDGTQEEKNLITGQLHFFRGFYHLVIMEFWGGLPYFDESIDLNSAFNYPRLSYQECADRVAEDMRIAADLLPVDWDQTAPGRTTLGNNNLRINKVMALCYLGKNWLWAGSPLMNYASTGNRSYDQEYCRKAADVLAEALQICESTRRYELADFSQYSEIFWNRGQRGRLPGLKETVFWEHLIEHDGRFRWNMINNYRPYALINSGYGFWPTANYVNYYGMANGLPIPDLSQPDPESGYDPMYPWKNRDPRFYHDFMVDGERCVQDEARVGGDKDLIYASLYAFDDNTSDNEKRNGSLRRGVGGQAMYRQLTGYMLSKYVPKLLNIWDGYRDGNTMVISLMRLADVYLLYAEAAAQGYGTPQSKAGSYGLSALDAVNKIRERAGVDPVNSKFTGNLDSFMSELRRERAVELSFEGHRFTDLRRWMLLLERPYTLKTAIYFDRDPEKEPFDDPVNAKVLNLREKVIFERQYDERHYWLPFLRDDVNLSKEFKQNPGW